MRIHFSILAGIALSLALGGLLAGDTARAEDESGGELPAQHQVYDIRIVRVATPTPAGVEAPCPFLTGDATTIQATWPEILAALKKRGTTSLLMDQRITTSDGIVAKVDEERQIPLVLMQSRTLTSENHAAARIRSGCDVELIYALNQGLRYKVLVRGTWKSVVKDATAATETLSAWEGAHARLRGRTLVLSFRTQRRSLEDAAVGGVEIYCFIHGRDAAAR